MYFTCWRRGPQFTCDTYFTCGTHFTCGIKKRVLHIWYIHVRHMRYTKCGTYFTCCTSHVENISQKTIHERPGFTMLDILHISVRHTSHLGRMYFTHFTTKNISQVRHMLHHDSPSSIVILQCVISHVYQVAGILTT